jgi:hypothetical protein
MLMTLLKSRLQVDCSINTGVPAAVNFSSVHHQVQPVRQVTLSEGDAF